MQIAPEIRIEALRIARDMVKAAILMQGHKLSWVTFSEITAAAEELLKQRPDELIPKAWDICKMRYEARKAV